MCVCVFVCAEKDEERKKEREGEERVEDRRNMVITDSLSSTMLTLYKINH